MFNSILVVCTGNICRSPTGERLLRRELANLKITSAGIGALVGKPAYSMSVEVAKSHGLSLEGHVARQITKADCQENDLILVMEKQHLEYVCKLSPEIRGKVMFFGHWLDRKETPDPYGKSLEAYEFAYNHLNESALKWAEMLQR
ncbi:protein tyrosine phosphatase [Raoultella sp. Ech2A]|uniref:arsenate reductase/protein-tyrosine-phosphatase family protein n=1 Tax=Raoultella sp. Ech2A TaxID=2996539 RepID=UPI0024C03E7E|nr:protein tyrosine phosphatase [Raoultella sp. Ech2A]MDJ1652705.1 protein tyrosine phosphatase [Raoultella sp. Ech2A]